MTRLRSLSHAWHVTRGLAPVELAAAREADARTDALVARLRGRRA